MIVLLMVVILMVVVVISFDEAIVYEQNFTLNTLVE